MKQANWIQRLDTIGGKAPAEGCDRSRKDAEMRVDYSATYHFYGSQVSK